MSPRQPTNQDLMQHINVRNTPSYVSLSLGVFTHWVPVKYLVTGVIKCSAVMSQTLYRRFFSYNLTALIENRLVNEEIER